MKCLKGNIEIKMISEEGSSRTYDSDGTIIHNKIDNAYLIFRVNGNDYKIHCVETSSTRSKMVVFDLTDKGTRYRKSKMLNTFDTLIEFFTDVKVISRAIEFGDGVSIHCKVQEDNYLTTIWFNNPGDYEDSEIACVYTDIDEIIKEIKVFKSIIEE